MSIVSVAFTMLLTAIAPAPALAAPGYELNPAKPSISLPADGPHGVAIDQSSQAIYVSELTTNTSTGTHGQVMQLDANGVSTPHSPFVTGDTDYFVGVAVNPLTHGVYAYQTQVSTPFGPKGSSKISKFSSSGAMEGSFVPPQTAIQSAPQLAVDSSGRLFLPNDGANAIQVFDSSGALKESILCTGCLGGAFTEPASVALDSVGNLYVVDLGGGGRAIRLRPSGGSYVYDSVLQSGVGAAAIAVDPTSDDVFIGDTDAESGGYHIVAYDSAGEEFDDFGAEIVGSSTFGRIGAGQIAVNATTRKLYVTDPAGDRLWIFDRIASIPLPTASTSPASPVGQLDATLNAAVNPKGHSLSDCHFEYTDHADFLTSEFGGATSIPCLFRPGRSLATVSAKATGLDPGTAYDYRIAITSSGGEAKGAAQTFEALPPLPPDATTGAASPIAQTTATLTGVVNARGGPVGDCHFDYATDADFQQKAFAGAATVACAQNPAGTKDTPVSAKVTSLAATTGYRFRLVATNNSGTTEGQDQGFATLADTCATSPVLCPPPAAGRQPTSPPPASLLPAPPIGATKKPLKCRKGFRKKTVRGKAKCVKVKKHRRRRG